MATAAAPDGVIVDVGVRGVVGSPSQERLGRIAAMLRNAEPAVAATFGRDDRERGQHPRANRSATYRRGVSGRGRRA